MEGINAPGNRPRSYRLADLRIDTGQRRLWRGDEEIELPKLSFNLLVALLEAAPNCLSTDELIERTWDGAVVSPTTVAKRVELLRQALGEDSSDPRYIGVVRGHGYRLLPEPEPADPETVSMPASGPVSGAARDGATAAPAGPARRSRPWSALPWVAALLILAALVLLWPRAGDEPAPPERSVAVLPLLAVGGDPADQRFADGLTEELGNALAAGGDLRVAGRTSSFAIRDRETDPRRIGKALGVAHLLEGTVRRSADRLRITAQLVSAEDGLQLWSESYDRAAGDVLDIQREIARSVAGRLRAALGPAGRAPAPRAETADPEAYALYLQARGLASWGGRTSDLAPAQALLERAVALDPEFAAAWAFLAAIQGRRILWDPGVRNSADEMMQRTVAAVSRAIALDPDSAEIHMVLGGMAWAFQKDLPLAASHIEKSLEIEPWQLDRSSFAADFAKAIGRPETALALEAPIVALDPLCHQCRERLAATYLQLGRWGDAEREYLTLADAGHEPGRSRWNAGVARLLQGRPEAALELFESLATEDATRGLAQAGRAMAWHEQGRETLAAEALGSLRETPAQPGSTPAPATRLMALAYTGRVDEAFGLLNDPPPDILYFLELQRTHPMLRNLRADPRWRDLLVRIGRAPEDLAALSFDPPAPLGYASVRP